MEQNEQETPSLLDVRFAIDKEGKWDSHRHSIDASVLEGHHAIVVFAKGNGILLVNGRAVQVRSGTAVIVRPQSQLKVKQLSDSDFLLSGYWITFNIYSGSTLVLDMKGCLTYEQPLAPAPFIKVVDLLEQLINKRPNTGKLALFKQQIRLQELLLLLLEHHDEASQSVKDAMRAVERSVAFMKEHYGENITVELLARQAGVRRAEYSSLFQQLTGNKPLDYLTELRMKRAKELLLLSNGPLRDIAHHVGFRDEYYFNRRFRQSMGISPKQYARTHPSKLNITDNQGLKIELPLQPQYSKIVVVGFPLGHLMALGVRPVGADMTVIGKQVVYRDKLQHIHDIGPSEDYAKIKALEPDFIFCCSTVSLTEVPISRIAPTLVINRADSSFEQLRLMAAVVGKSPYAEKWIKSYKTKLKAMWSQLRLDIGVNETAAVIVIVGGELYVMGTNGLASTLYHPLGFKPSEKVRELIEQGIDFQGISVEMLQNYTGDRLFLLIGEDQVSLDAAELLVKSPFWQELLPVQKNLVYRMHAKWNYDDAITLEQLLTVLPGVLHNKISLRSLENSRS
ncbi:helix-turn-helix domain-containing protein [Paenibacillus radicis (ex Gao et al. 2016)]|uniref:Helix-turn-helix domain-containing protein n=1 Tax=Paenibacillus radicis (ex Gao et al. 2016) TaxID=1737354 RepID=A0A917LVU8_9BACL|nr:AraC family transcriptional regulator [Paenibacillus radicis (ex Gao et al. 2016)]GGG59985.1 hypothetical protein GCM10010918_11500 [Paenibacillus radicis (ex Gao et al. 2016)]